MKKVVRPLVPYALALAALALGPAAEARSKSKSAQQIRQEYLERVTQTSKPVDQPFTGSLWAADGKLTYLAADYKASRLHDSVIILVVQQTTATASGTTDTQRDFNTSSAITALPGRLKVSGVNPLLGANSSNKLKGQGQIASASKLQTSLAGQVIAVLPNGNLVVEAQREILLNHERETAIVRGIARPGDVGPNNIVLSTSLSDLEIELKGKGVVSDATRPPNLFTRSLQWIFGF